MSFQKVDKVKQETLNKNVLTIIVYFSGLFYSYILINNYYYYFNVYNVFLIFIVH